MNKSSARTKYFVNVQLGLIDVGYHGYIIAVIQNVTNSPIKLKKGKAVAQLLILPSQIPDFDSNWPISTYTRGGFGSTSQNFETIDKKVASNNYFLRSSKPYAGVFGGVLLPWGKGLKQMLSNNVQQHMG